MRLGILAVKLPGEKPRLGPYSLSKEAIYSSSIARQMDVS